MSEESGPFDFQAYLIDMNKLFKRFVTQALRERAGDKVTIDAQAPLYLGYEQKVLMRPDIILSSGGAVKVVVDCKYKRLIPSGYKNHDLYQMLAYCTAARVQRGLLI